MTLALVGEQPHATRGRHHLLETHGFSPRHLTAERSEFVRPATFVTVIFWRQLHDQLVIQKPFNEAVEGSSTQANVAAGALFDLFENQVAVCRAIGER